MLHHYVEFTPKKFEKASKILNLQHDQNVCLRHTTKGLEAG